VIIVTDTRTRTSARTDRRPGGVTVLYPLFLIFNQSFKTGVLPYDWKLAEVTAVHKKGSKTVRSNYRPVSLTIVCCKLLESWVRDHMINYLLDNRHTRKTIWLY